MGRVKKYSGVTGFTGLPGSGKSYALAEMAFKARKRGVPVYANAGFNVDGAETISSFKEFAELQGPGIVVWDELPLYFSARRWQSFPDGMLYKMSQIRKDGLQLYYSTIHPRLVDVTLRSITFVWVDCRHVAGRLVRRTYRPPEEFGEKEEYYKEFHFLKRKVMDSYDTWGRVEVQDSERLQALPEGEWSKPAFAGAGSGLPGSAPQPVGEPFTIAGEVVDGEVEIRSESNGAGV